MAVALRFFGVFIFYETIWWVVCMYSTIAVWHSWIHGGVRMYTSLDGPQDAVSYHIRISLYSNFRRMAIHNSWWRCIVYILDFSIRSSEGIRWRHPIPRGHQMKASDPKRVSDEWSGPVFLVNLHGSEMWGHFWWDLATLDSIQDVSVDVHVVQSFSFQVWSF